MGADLITEDDGAVRGAHGLGPGEVVEAGVVERAHGNPNRGVVGGDAGPSGQGIGAEREAAEGEDEQEQGRGSFHE